MPAPANDNIANRQALGASGSITPITIDGATVEASEPSGSDFSALHRNQTVWYEWTAPADGIAVFDTLGSVATDGNGDPSGGLDTTMAAWTATDPTDFGTFTEVASDDDDPTLSGTHYTSRVSFLAASGTTYLIQVGTYGATYTGTLHLNWSSTPYSPDGPGNDACSNALTLAGTSGHRDAETLGWAGVWPTGADPIFEQFGHGGQPLWWKYTNGGTAPVQFKAVFAPSPIADRSSTGLYAALMIGACGSLAVDLAADHIVKTAGAINPNGTTPTVDVILQPGDTVFLEVEIDADTAEPPGTPANGRTAYSFDWTVSASSTRDCMTGQTALADTRAALTTAGATFIGQSRAQDSILVGDKVYVASELDYTLSGVNHYTARVSSINTDGTGYTEAAAFDTPVTEYGHGATKGSVQGSEGNLTGGSGGSTNESVMFLAYDGHDVLLAVLTIAGAFSGHLNYYVDVYREDAGAWTNIATLTTEDLKFTALAMDSFESFRIAASPTGPRKLWVGLIYAYIDNNTGLPTDRFTRYEIDTSTGGVTTLYDDFDDGGGAAIAIEDVAAVGTAQWWIEADEGYPILLWQKHTGFNTTEPNPAFNGRSGWDGFLTAERFDTKALIQEIHRSDLHLPSGQGLDGPGTPSLTDDIALAHGSNEDAYEWLRTGNTLKMFGRFFCDETGQYERFISLWGWTNFYDGSGDLTATARLLFRTKSDLTGPPEAIDSPSFRPLPGVNNNAGFTSGESVPWAVTTPLYDGERNVWTIGDALARSGGSVMFQYDRRCSHAWLDAMNATVGPPAFSSWEGDLWQRGGWDADLYFYLMGNDMQIWKLGPVERDCVNCIPIAPLVAGLYAWQTF